MGLVFGSVCSGIEAASVAWEPLGWRAAFLSEIEPAPRAVLAYHYPGVPIHGDFTTIRAGDYADIDVLVGGTPCQDFSVAGLRSGLDGERGNLTLAYADLAYELGSEWLVWENVPGVFSSNDGRDFGSVLACFAGYPASTMFEPPRDGWRSAGVVPPAGPDCYGLAWRVLDAQYVRVDGFAGAVPQRRRRVFVVGCLGDWRRAAAVLFERESLSGNPAPCREAREVVAGTLSASSGRRSADDPERGGLIAGTLDAAGDRGGTLQDAVGGRLIPACLNGLGEYGADVPTLRAKGGDAAGGSEALLAFGGNNTSGPVNVAAALQAHAGPAGRQDFATETFVAHSLRGEGFDASEDGTGRGTPLVPICFDARQSDVIIYGDGAGPLDTDAFSQAIAFDTTQITSPANRNAPRPGDPCHPLSAGAHPPAVAFTCSEQANSFAWERDVYPTLDAQVPNDTSNIQKGIRQGWAVRRLTPTECERLQGYRDGYTQVPFRGRPMADGPRYKMLGNSMPVNVMRWIGMRIAMVDALTAQRNAA